MQCLRKTRFLWLWSDVNKRYFEMTSCHAMVLKIVEYCFTTDNAYLSEIWKNMYDLKEKIVKNVSVSVIPSKQFNIEESLEMFNHGKFQKKYFYKYVI